MSLREPPWPVRRITPEQLKNGMVIWNDSKGRFGHRLGYKVQSPPDLNKSYLMVFACEDSDGRLLAPWASECPNWTTAEWIEVRDYGPQYYEGRQELGEVCL